MGAGDAGRVIGSRYECVELIGRGGMGEVWRARDTLLQRDVAVKRLTYGDPTGDDVTVGRSMREARLAARLNHPNAVAIYDVVVDEDVPCLVMALVRGTSLKEVIAQQGRVDPIVAARIGRQVAAALGVAHRAGIIHRDVKPANVLIASDGTAKLTDFGIARDEGDAGLTSTGTFLGTPNFVAPEIALGGSHTPAGDVWALGALLYTAVEGDQPYSMGGNALAILNRIATTDAPVPTHAGPLTDVIVQAMHRDPAARPAAATIVQLLDDVIDRGRHPSGGTRTSALRQHAGAGLHAAAGDRPAGVRFGTAAVRARAVALPQRIAAPAGRAAYLVSRRRWVTRYRGCRRCRRCHDRREKAQRVAHPDSDHRRAEPARAADHAADADADESLRRPPHRRPRTRGHVRHLRRAVRHRRCAGVHQAGDGSGVVHPQPHGRGVHAHLRRLSRRPGARGQDPIHGNRRHQTCDHLYQRR